jgi:hypothetical protein
MVRKKRKWADVKDEVLKTKKEGESGKEAVEVHAKGESKKAKARPSVRREKGEEVGASRPEGKVPASVRSARPALGKQSQSRAWTYHD